MQALKPPKTLKVYQLLKRNGLSMYNATGSSNINGVTLGPGFFLTQHDAEMHRTMELLKLQPGDASEFFVFELELPNPVYKENE